MQIRSNRELGALWAGAVAFFFVCAWASTMLLPTTRTATGPTASYYVGLGGLLAIGLALGLTWVWLGRKGPASRLARVGLQVVLVIGTLLWLVAMVFPFL